MTPSKSTTKGATKSTPAPWDKAASAAKTRAAKDRAENMPETVAGLMIRRGDKLTAEEHKAIGPDDLVLVFKNAYAVGGIPTNSGKDTRKLATSPGMFTWGTMDPDSWGAHPSGRKVGIKATVLLSSPIEEKADGTKAEADESERTMSPLL
jgi:hypothetical protein